MNPLEFPLLADESIAPTVVETLARQGKDVRSVHDEGLAGAPDVDVLRHANAQNRVVLTHDSDFGRLVFLSGEPFVGIIFLRPGHIDAAVVLETIAAIERHDEHLTPPFMLVAERKGETVRVRVRAIGQP